MHCHRFRKFTTVVYAKDQRLEFATCRDLPVWRPVVAAPRGLPYSMQPRSTGGVRAFGVKVFMSELRIPPDEELEFTFFRSSGPGGQKKNTTDSAVRVRHLPTGLVVVSTSSRSQFQNKQLAVLELARRLAVLHKRPRTRHATRPTLVSRARRLEMKRKRSETKRLRASPKDE